MQERIEERLTATERKRSEELIAKEGRGDKIKKDDKYDQDDIDDSEP